MDVQAPAWETSKENVLPIKRGRSVRGLQESSLALQQQNSLAETETNAKSNSVVKPEAWTSLLKGGAATWNNGKQATEEGFEAAIKELKELTSANAPEQLLEKYAKYIKWTRDTYISDTTKALKLLEVAL